MKMSKSFSQNAIAIKKSKGSHRCVKPEFFLRPKKSALDQFNKPFEKYSKMTYQEVPFRCGEQGQANSRLLTVWLIWVAGFKHLGVR
jgi:hypothetical protein